MYELNDTIVAVSSPTSEKRVIVRITGSGTIEVLRHILDFPVVKGKSCLRAIRIAIDDELSIDAKLYLFLTPHSYTGDDVAEIHIHTNSSVTEALIDRLLDSGLRMAGPGEFTARAYMAGKIDLAQAEAVNEIIISSNKLQLAAAEKLLAGRLAETTAEIRSSLIDCLSLIEARLDFSGEDIEFITRPEAVKRLFEIKEKLQQLLLDRYRDESVIDLPSAGIAGAANAGKSSLLNILLGKTRSVVSEQRKTTRDVLAERLTLKYGECVLFDCAGLIQEPDNILDECAQQAAIVMLNKASVVVFCVDISKVNWDEDISIYELIEPEMLIPVATKSDLITEDVLAERLTKLNELFSLNFIATSVKNLSGTESLKETIDRKIIGSRCLKYNSEEIINKHQLTHTYHQVTGITLTARHKHAIAEAIENITESVSELERGNDELTAMMLRTAYQTISNIEQEPIDEQILESIFSRFCIGK